MKFQLKTDGLKGDTLAFAEQMNKSFADLPEGTSQKDVESLINSRFKELMGEEGKFKFISVDEFKALTDENDPKSLKSIVKAQGTLINQLKESGNKNEMKYLVDVLDEYKEAFMEIKNRKSGIFEMAIKDDVHQKAAAVTAISTGGSVTSNLTTGTTLRLGDGPIYEIKRNVPFILDFVNVGETNQPYLIWWDEQSMQGNFAITAEGATKPLVQYEFKRQSADYKKAAGYSVLTEEFMNDLPQLVTMIKRLAQIDVMLALNAQILSDMIAVLPTFTYTALNGKVYHADDYAAIGAAIAQIQSFFYTPTVLVLNPADAWKMKLTKDDVGRYQMPPFAFNGSTFEFGQVIVNPAIAVDHFIIGEGDTYNVDMKGGIIIRIGYNGTDFIQNQMTILVEQYYYNYISTNRLNAWVYGWFSLIKGAINDMTNS